MWRQFLAWFASKLSFIDIAEEDGRRFMRRYFLRRGHNSWSLYLHHFVGSDPDRGLHDHPAGLGVALLLSGKYYEQRYKPGSMDIITRSLHAPSINVIRGTDFHRVLLPKGKEAWTLFFRTPRVKRWGFLS